MIETITTGWNFFRILRFVTGIAVLIQSIILQEWLLAAAGIFLAGMALFTRGCGANGCATRMTTFQGSENAKEIEYEELDDKK